MSETTSPRGRRNIKFIYMAVIISALYYSYMTGDVVTSCIVISLTTLAWFNSNIREEQELENPRKIMKIGLDIHGVCDANPAFFQELTRLFVSQGHEVHILTGRRVSDGAKDELVELGLKHTHFFSIADYHEESGTKMKDDNDGNPWMDDEVWDRTKGDYCKRHQIDFCIDDTERYGQYFETPFAYINIKNQ